LSLVRHDLNAAIRGAVARAMPDSRGHQVRAISSKTPLNLIGPDERML
jgi:hypothetical protein